MNTLVVSAAAYLAVVASAALAGRLLPPLVRRTDAPLRWYRRGVALLCPAAALAAFGALESTGAFGALASALPIRSTPGFLGFLAGIVLSAGPVMFVPYLTSARAYGDLRGYDVEPVDALRQLLRFLFSSMFPLVVAAWFAFAVDGGALVVAGAVFAGTVGALAVGSPLQVVLGRRTRRPTGAERERIDTALDRANVTVRRVRVMPTSGGSAQVVVCGVPGWRYLFLTDAVLDEFDEGGVSALVAIAGSHADRYLPAVWFATFGLVAGTISWALGTPLLAIGVGWAAANEFARLVSYRGDAAAADRSGLDPTALSAALERVATLHDRGGSPSTVGRVVLGVPDFPRRLSALRTRTGPVTLGESGDD